MNRTAKPFLPHNKQGIVIDTIIVLSSFIVFPFFTARVTNLFEQSIVENSEAFHTLAVLMIIILTGRLGGLYLKRFPLQARLQKSEQTDFPSYFLIFNIPVLILTGAFAAILLAALFGQAGIVETRFDGSPKDSPVVTFISISIIIVLVSLEIYFLFCLSKSLSEEECRKAEKRLWKFNWKGEFIADFGLFAYMMIWQVFYNYTASILLMPPTNVKENPVMKIISIVFTFIIFLIFYLSPRAVFLIEDRRYKGTWLFIFLVFISSIAWYL
ncbi:MAG: hypothetical protein R2681_14250 [Pyrinomonadaceae bacterium]